MPFFNKHYARGLVVLVRSRMSSDEHAGPSRPKRQKKAAEDENYVGLNAEEVASILRNVDSASDLYLSSEEEPFQDSGSEYLPESSSESEFILSDNEFENENYIEQNIEQNIEGEGGTQDEMQATEQLNIQWTDNIFVPQKHAFNDDQCGINPDLNLNENSKEIDYFSSLFTDDIADLIIQETNRYGLQHENGWKELDKSEFYTFLTLNLLMPRNKKLAVHEYWSKEPLLHSPIFGQCMPRDRFCSIYRNLHFCNNEADPANDRLFKLRDILNKIKEKFQYALQPFEGLVIDESLVLFKGRLVFKQYIKSKRHRFGIKLYVLCDCDTGFILDFIVYVGKDPDISNNPVLGITGEVVMKLMRPYLYKGHSLYTDNFYTSPSLSLHLFERQTNSCGTVRPNRKGMPKLKPKLDKGETSWQSSDKLLALKWKDRRDVYMLTTMHENEIITLPKVDRITKENKKKPLCVVAYNEKMGAVDRSDMLVSSIDSMRKNIKWYKKLFFHTLDLCVLNSHALFLTQSAKRLPLANFHLNLASQILDKYKISFFSCTVLTDCLFLDMLFNGKYHGLFLIL